MAWGDNAAGQTNVPSGATNVTAVTAGELHSLALSSDGNVIGWGATSYGLTNIPADVSGVKALAAGDYFNVVLSTNGFVKVWGDNSWNQTNVPVGLSNVTAVAAGLAHCLALRSDGGVIAWGRNYEKQTNVPVGLTNVIAIAAGDVQSIALTSEGKVIAWGGSANGNVPVAATNVVSICGSASSSFAVKLDGTVVGWGASPAVPSYASNIVMLAGGGYHTLGLRSDGTVIGWGANLYGSLDIPADLTNATGIAAGGYHSVAIAKASDGGPIVVAPPLSRLVFDGTTTLLNVGVVGDRPLTYQWLLDGFELNGATNAFLELTNLRAVNAGGYSVVISNASGSVTSSVALLTLNSSPPIIFHHPTNVVAGWGKTATFSAETTGSLPANYQWRFEETNIPGQTNLALTLTNIDLKSTGNYSLAVTNQYGFAVSSNAMLSVAPIAAWGAGQSNSNSAPHYGQSIIPPSATNVLGIAAGGFHSLALQGGGKLLAWGWNSYGQTTVPSAATNIISIAAGDRHSLALRGDGVVLAWGDIAYNQRAVPGSANNVTAIASGWYHNLAITNGGVMAWGAGMVVGVSPNLGQSIVPALLSNVVAVAGGGYHSLALKQDGTVVGWGWNAAGQTNIPAGLNNVIGLAAGGSNSLALKADGTVIGWGSNSYGQTNVPAGLSNIVAIAAYGNSCMALSAGGNLTCWGDNATGQTNAPVGLTNIVGIAAGRSHSMALVNDGSLLILSQPTSFNVTNGATVKFKVSTFGAPPISYQWRWNGTNLVGATTATLQLTNVAYWNEGSYSVLVNNAARTTISSNGWLNVFDVGEALDAANLVWTNNGIGVWVVEGAVTHDGVAAVACGPLIYGQPPSAIQSTVNGPGTLTFWWQGTSPYASLKFFIDGALQSSLPTGGTWVQKSFSLTSGPHSLSWTAANSWSLSSTGMAYLDQVIFVPDPVPLQFDVASLRSTTGGFTFDVTGLSGRGPAIIYTSTNLVDWQPIHTNPPQVGSLQFLDASATNQPAQFYRVLEQ